MDRQSLVDRLMFQGMTEGQNWTDRHNGLRDWKGTAIVEGRPEWYTDEELAKLAAFSDAVTAKYDGMFARRSGANLWEVGRISEGVDHWVSKRRSWTIGRMYSQTLDEAITFLLTSEFREGAPEVISRVLAAAQSSAEPAST